MSQAEFEDEHRGPTVRDRRRIDPETYEVREPQEAAAPPTTAPDQPDAGGDSEVIELQAALAERTADLQRLQAEYVNYKRRVDRDRDVSRKVTIESVVRDLLAVLDDVRSAREHGELTGGFKAVGDELERVTGKYGLTAFGEKGDPFDPHIHEALLHSHAEGIDGPTCVEILQPGYRIGDRVLRPARVAVAEPDPDAAPAAPSSTDGEPAQVAPDSAEASDRVGSSGQRPRRRTCLSCALPDREN